MWPTESNLNRKFIEAIHGQIAATFNKPVTIDICIFSDKLELHRLNNRMMALSKEERIQLVLLSGREGWSYRKIAEEFNLRHPYRRDVRGVDVTDVWVVVLVVRGF
ncbi:Hypothetical predicted protein [Octopus vulgaris]|uniref:Uncharacterized protein n=1 Tax=Octopus vulgaris TaxID=6645 RepID=A0AA36B0A1_OCTVU|nr:Hypothetical predicted protein [Octopus vulgaris]